MNTTCYTEPAVMRQLSSQESISDSLETKFCLEKVPTSRRSPSKLTSMQMQKTRESQMERSCTCLLLVFCSGSLTYARSLTHTRRRHAQMPRARANRVQVTTCPVIQSLEPTDLPRLALPAGFYSVNSSSTIRNSATQSSLSNISDSSQTV